MKIYTFLAKLFSRFDFQLYDMDEASMVWLDKGIATNHATVKMVAKPL